MAEKKEQQGTWLKVFCPDARCLSEEEVAALPPEKLQAADESGKSGLWLEVFCPDGACLTEAEKGNATRPATPDQAKGGPGYWLSLFCPDDKCQIGGAGDIS